MFRDSPVFSILTFGIAAGLLYVWITDFIHYRKCGVPRHNAFEGATPAPRKLLRIAALSALALLSFHVWTESSLGLIDDQTAVTPWALLAWISAAFVEELIFRGYFVVQNKGRAVLISSIVIFSVLFAAAHPFLWDYIVPDGAHFWEGVWSFTPDSHAAVSTLAIFECSLLFYALRFIPMNRERSLLPCMVAHLSYNLGVFAVKLLQGFIL